MPQPPSTLRRLLHYATPHRSRVIAATVYSVFNKVFDVAPPFLMGIAIDVVVEQENSIIADWLGIESTRTQLVALAAATFVIWALESAFEYLQRIAWRNLAQTIEHELRMDAYGHIQELELAFFEDRSSGGLMAVLNDDVNQLERFLDQGANEIVQLVVSTTFIAGSFIFFAPSVALLAFFPIPLIAWGSLRFQRRLEPRYAAVRQEAGTVNAELGNNLGGIATIKSFVAEGREAVRIGEASQRYRLANAEAIRVSSAFTPLIRIAILFGFMATLVWGGFLTLDGRLAESVYVTMVFLTQRLLWPLTRLGETLDLYQRGMASAARILDVLDTEPQIVDGPRRVARTDIRGSVAFRDVGFSYVPGTPVISDFSVEIAPGETTAFVGSTGAGKTTLIKLLLRFYDPVSGSIEIDGIDLRDLSLADLRSAVGLVSQDVFLFHGTVRDNIAYGRPDATDAEIAEAAAVAEQINVCVHPTS